MDILSVLTYFGFTPANVTPLVVVGVIGLMFVFKHTKPIRDSLQDIRERFARLEGSLSGAFQAQSPIALKPIGLEALEKSGFKKWIDEHEDQILAKCSFMKNPYDIQETAFKLFDQMDFGDFEPKIKEAAFGYGWSLETMKRVGAIYFRDLCLKNHGYSPDDLDRPKS